MYTGTFNAIWLNGKRELGVDIMTVSDIPGRVWPVTDFSVDRTRTAEFLFSDLDFTEIGAKLDPIGKNTWVTFNNTNGPTSDVGALAAFMAANSPFPVVADVAAAANNYSLGGVSCYNMDISTITSAMIATFPFLANPKPGFNRCLVLRNIPWANSGVAPSYAPLYYNV